MTKSLKLQIAPATFIIHITVNNNNNKNSNVNPDSHSASVKLIFFTEVAQTTACPPPKTKPLWEQAIIGQT